jgi:hypothetical protein
METVKFYRDHICTPKNLVVIFDHGDPVVIRNNNARFGEIRDMLRNGEFDAIPSAVSLALSIETKTKGKFKVVNGTVEIDGELLPNALSDKLIEFVERALPTAPLERFWDNLKANPAQSAREDLFAFLEANRVALTADGCFVVYKKVREDWYDSYTGSTHLNKPGNVVSMNREYVDGDRRNTCSAGLHVAAWGYASTFSGQRILEVKVSPQDVVAVPPDYSQQKMRVCRYTVLRQTDQEYDGSIYDEAKPAVVLGA